ncbi:MAG: TetR/AcrR family transcriptional regulator [Polyangiaceae bacterium]
MASRKKRYHHGDLRAELLRAARRCLEREGVEALTLRQVARAVGVSHAAPAHHFADKQALLAAVAAQGFDELTASMIAAREIAPADAVSRLNATGVAYVGYAAAHPNLFRLMFGRELSGCDQSVFADAAARAYEVLQTAAKDVIQESDRTDDLPVVITSAWSLVHGMSLLWLDGRILVGAPAHALERMATDVTSLVGLALKAQTGPATPRRRR